MSLILRRLKTGRSVWTLLVTFYFLVFFRNFFLDAFAGQAVPAVIFAWVFVVWLAVEYSFGSPFFQSGVVEPSTAGRGAFACFVYPYLGYLVGDFGWWNLTQLPVPPVASWVVGIVLFLAGTGVRLATLAELVRAVGTAAERGAGKRSAGRVRERSLFDSLFFRLCRHPRYLAVFAQLVGAALVFNSWGGLVLAGTLGLGLIYWQARSEDRTLTRLLKQDYQSYAGRVPMFWPRLRQVSR